jgi:hypothetical protein
MKEDVASSIATLRQEMEAMFSTTEAVLSSKRDGYSKQINVKEEELEDRK